MTFDQMTMDQASDAAIRISAAVSFVLEDKEVAGLIDDISKTGGNVEIASWIPTFLPRISGVLFKKHRNALYEIVGALTQQDAKMDGKIQAGEVICVI